MIESPNGQHITVAQIGQCGAITPYPGHRAFKNPFDKHIAGHHPAWPCNAHLPDEPFDGIKLLHNDVLFFTITDFD